MIFLIYQSRLHRKSSAFASWRTIPVTPFAVYQRSSDMIEPGMNIIICFTCEEYIAEFNQGNFGKFCVAVSFNPVDLKFLVQ